VPGFTAAIEVLRSPAHRWKSKAADAQASRALQFIRVSVKASRAFDVCFTGAAFPDFAAVEGAAPSGFSEDRYRRRGKRFTSRAAASEKPGGPAARITTPAPGTLSAGG
jgi:hypothetical protein